jgi:hypothetical protein
MNGGLTLIYKDERPGQKVLCSATTPGLGQPWSPGKRILDRDWIEGPSVLKVNGVWRLYFDCYTKGHYGAAESEDGVTWRDITDQVKFPQEARHGTAFRVPPDILESLKPSKP